MIEYDGETYLTVNEIAQRLNISWGTCRTNVLQQMQACHLPGRKRAHYRLSDVEAFSQVRTTSPCRAFPASSSKEETGNETTSSSHTTLHSSLQGWQDQYSLPVQFTQARGGK